MDLFKKLVYLFLSLQEKILTNQLYRTLGVKHTSKRKKVFGNGVMLSLDSLADAEKSQMESELELILKNSDYETDKILEYIKNQGTQIFYINNPDYLHSIGENEGFIYPQKGAKALYLSFLTKQKPSFNTSEMFIIPSGELNKYYFVYHLYNWYAFKHGIAGIDSESQDLLNKYLFDASEEDFKKLQLNDIYKLKDAIKQDKSAIEFVFRLCQKVESSKTAFDKLKNNSTSI